MNTMNKRANDRYMKLIRQFPLVSIRTKSAADKATQVLDRLVGREGEDPGQDAYVNALTDLLESYEREHENDAESGISGVDALRELIEQNNIKQADLANQLGISAPAMSLILSGDRGITIEHAKALEKIFAVNWTVFV